MVIFDYVVFYSCRGAPRGPHNPLELLGVQGIGLETKAKERDKNYPICQKTRDLHVTKWGNFGSIFKNSNFKEEEPH